MVLYYFVVDVNDGRSNGTGKGVRQMEARMMGLQRRRREKIPCIRSLFQLDSAARAEQDGAIWVLSRAEQTRRERQGGCVGRGAEGHRSDLHPMTTALLSARPSVFGNSRRSSEHV